MAKLLKKLFASNRKGFGDIKTIIGTLVAGAILLMVGIYTYTKVRAPVQSYFHDYTSYGVTTATATAAQNATIAAQNATFGNIQSNTLSAFDLSAIIFIVLAAGGIIGVLLLAFR